MKQKNPYEAPVAEVFVVQIEDSVLQTGSLFNETNPGLVGVELTLEDDFIYNL